MKVVVPKHVEAWLFDMGMDIGPIRLKMRQMFFVAIGVGLTFAVMKPLMQWGLGKLPAFIIASPILIFFLILAFFRRTELNFIPFVIKMITTYIINSPRRFQKNTSGIDKSDIILKYAQSKASEELDIKYKNLDIEENKSDIDTVDQW